MAVYLVPAGEGRPIVLDKAVVFVGRHPECDVVLKSSRKVSRKHCCLAQVDDRIVIRDLGSMNGIQLNGKRVTREASVSVGDEITIGDVVYTLKSRRGMLEDAQKNANAPVIKNRKIIREPTPAEPAGERPPLDISQNFPVPLPSDSAIPEADSVNHKPAGSNSDDPIIMLDDDGDPVGG